MSRGRDNVPTTKIPLGDCDCPNGVHGAQSVASDGTISGGDIAIAFDRFNFGGVRRVAGAATRAFFDPTGYKIVAVEAGLKSWNLVDEKGRPLPIDADTIDGLSAEQGRKVVDHFDEGEVYIAQLKAFRAESEQTEDEPPNGSGGPSADGPAETPRPTSSSPAGPSTTRAADSSAPSASSSAPSSLETLPTSS